MISPRLVKKHALYAMLCVLPSISSAQFSNVHGGKNLTLRCSVENFKIDTISSHGTFARVSIPEGVDPMQRGEPTLPQLATLVAVGDADSVAVSIIDTVWKEFTTLPLVPSAGNVTREEELLPIPLSESYRTDRLIPSNMVTVSDIFTLRDMRGVRLSVQPVQHNPVTGLTRIATSMNLSVTLYSGGIETRSFQTVASSNGEFQSIYQNHFVNASQNRAIIAEPEKMLVIAPEKFSAVLQPLIDWKNQKGINTRLALFPKDFGGSDEAAVMAYVKKAYAEEKITYLLLAGEIGDVPAVLQKDKDGSGPADALYSLVGGTDLMADLFVGRFSSTSVEDMKTMVDKTINYEKNPDPKGTWYNKAVGMASMEASSSEPGLMDITWQEEMKPVLEKYGYQYTPLYHIWSIVKPEDVNNAINTGTSWFNFMGHGLSSCLAFKRPQMMYWYDTDMKKLTNGNKLPVMIAVACNTGSSTETTCMAEQWLIGKNNGGIAWLGSTMIQDWRPPQFGQKEMVNLLCADTHLSLGGIVFNGKNKIVVDAGESKAKKTVETWALYGDPSLMVMTKTPTVLAVTVPQSISVSKGLTLTLPESIHGRASLYSPKKGLIDAAVISGSTVSLSAVKASGEKSVTLTITGRNKVPFIAEIPLEGTVGLAETAQTIQKTDIVSIKGSILTLNSIRASDVALNIFALNGRLLYSKQIKLSHGVQTIDLSSAGVGTKILSIEGNGISLVKKFVSK